MQCLRGLGLAALLALGACSHVHQFQDLVFHRAVEPDAAYITSAVNDPRRPQTDRDADANRKPAEMLSFAEVKQGQRIGELLPGRGYFTRLFAAAVGAQGRVYTIAPPSADPNAPAPIAAVAAQYPNVTATSQALETLSVAEPLDLVWTSQNYHDLHLNQHDIAAVNRAVFMALKPGGLYVVVDHSAADGTGATTTAQLHRIDQALARQEIEAAGFVFDSETQTLRNPADPRTANVFDASIRGHTDQFVIRFRKPS